MALAAQASSPRPGGRFGFARLERRSWVMMCPEPAGRPWAADAGDHHHGAGVTVRTLPQRPPGQRLEPLAVVTGRFGQCGWRHPEQLPAALEVPRAVTDNRIFILALLA